MTESEEREIREYVASQTPPESGDEVSLVQKVGRRRAIGRTHDLYDVWMSSGQRWWVITDMTNLYSQDDFSSLDQVFTYHLGLNIVLREQFNMLPDEDQAEHVGKPWRRYAGAVDAMAYAEEAEDFQAVGIRCREVLLALVRDNNTADWVNVQGARPQEANVKEWFGIFANSLTANSKPRAYLKALAEKTWDLCVWLQHYVDASELDAEIVLGATHQLLRAFTLLRLRHGQPAAERCPNCDSYSTPSTTRRKIQAGVRCPKPNCPLAMRANCRAGFAHNRDVLGADGTREAGTVQGRHSPRAGCAPAVASADSGDPGCNPVDGAIVGLPDCSGHTDRRASRLRQSRGHVPAEP